MRWYEKLVNWRQIVDDHMWCFFYIKQTSCDCGLLKFGWKTGLDQTFKHYTCSYQHLSGLPVPTTWPYLTYWSFSGITVDIPCFLVCFPNLAKGLKVCQRVPSNLGWISDMWQKGTSKLGWKSYECQIKQTENIWHWQRSMLTPHILALTPLVTVRFYPCSIYKINKYSI